MINRVMGLVALMSLTAFVTACGPGRPANKERAVGVDTPLGQTLTKSKWCTPASTDGVERTKFSTLDLRQNGSYIKSSYVLAEDRALKMQSREHGHWSLIFDQLYTRANTPHATEAQSTVITTDVDAVVGSAGGKTGPHRSGTTAESCVTLEHR